MYLFFIYCFLFIDFYLLIFIFIFIFLMSALLFLERTNRLDNFKLAQRQQ